MKALGASRVWPSLIYAIESVGHEVFPRGLLCKELVSHISVVDMQYPIVMCPERQLGYRFMAAEAWWILTGQNRVSTIMRYADIARFSDDGHHFDGAYGPRVVDQVRYVVDSLIEDRHTRQAIMSIWRPNPRPSKDVPCTLTLQWLVRDGLLHCVANMRSSDAWLGWPYDVFNFTMISGYVLLLMRKKHSGVDYDLGNLYMCVGSQHLYERDWESAIDMEANTPDRLEVFDPLKYKNPDILIHELEMAKDSKRGALDI